MIMTFGKNFNLIWEAVVRPQDAFRRLAQGQDLVPGLMAWLLTAGLFAVSALTARLLHQPLEPSRFWPQENAPLVQTLLTPLILGMGWLLQSGLAWLLVRIFRVQRTYRSLVSLSGLALFIPLWLFQWPTDMAQSLGVFELNASGFVGLWVRELAPALTVLYLLWMLWLEYWLVLRVLAREAFIVAVVSLLPVLALWAWCLG